MVSGVLIVHSVGIFVFGMRVVVVVAMVVTVVLGSGSGEADEGQEDGDLKEIIEIVR